MYRKGECPPSWRVVAVRLHLPLVGRRKPSPASQMYSPSRPFLPRFLVESLLSTGIFHVLLFQFKCYNVACLEPLTNQTRYLSC